MEERARRPSLAFGLLLLVLGGAIVAVVMAADVGGADALERLAIQLGLAYAPLLLAIGLALALAGGWLVWRARGGRD